MAYVIDRQELLKRTIYNPLHPPYITEEDVNDMPSEEIVYCDECKYSKGEPIADGRQFCGLSGAYMRFCSDGERRADGRVTMKPTEKQIAYAKYLAVRMCQKLPEEFTKEAYSEFINKWKPIVKSEDDAMNEPDAWQMQYM
jgi:hypothetical protein